MSQVDGRFRLRRKGPFALAARQYARALVDIVLPASHNGAGPAALQANDFSRITFLEDPVCNGCGMGFEYDLAVGQDRCLACSARTDSYERVRAACVYDAHSRGLILALKHGDEQANAALFARWISRAADPLIQDCDVIVPVPLHPLRLLRRRFNQSAEIARPLAKARRRIYLPDGLKRVKATSSQGGKSLAGRKSNVRGAFKVTPRGAKAIAGKRVLLVDDVLTTGATANACAKALLRAGASGVDLAVIAGVQGAREMPT